jgi:16S rRNA (cytosine1402-N4)-methyltransferase
VTRHVPILVEPIVSALVEPFERLAPGSPRHYVVDCTFGGGGHSRALLERLPPDHGVIGIDQDPTVIERARENFANEIAAGRVVLHHSRFSEAVEFLRGYAVLGLLADLGFSSDQVDDPKRGLSFQTSGPLDMRLDMTRGISAREYLAQTSEQELERVLTEYGEERFSKRIAGAIVRARREGSLPSTTQELSILVVRAIPASARHGRIHAATRTFQAIRIAVNEELEELDRLLNDVILLVKPGGRVAFLSFHSLEDRKVKFALRGSDSFEPLTKKPIEAGDEEVARNPRARSAKLRTAERMSRHDESPEGFTQT